MFKYLLVPTDGSDLSRHAARTAVELARLSGARITAFHVAPAYRTSARGSNGTTIAPADYADTVKGQAEGFFDTIRALADKAGVTCDIEWTLSDFPAEAIVKAAEQYGCDTIVMGSHKFTGLNKVGSVALKVLMDSRVAVLVT